jgi:hypothetical protein
VDAAAGADVCAAGVEAWPAGIEVKAAGVEVGATGANVCATADTAINDRKQDTTIVFRKDIFTPQKFVLVGSQQL